MRPIMAKAIGYTKPDIDPNTRLYVPFNEGVGSVAKDYSQYGNHAQLTDVEWSPDGFNGAGKFNGSSSFGNCGNDASLNTTDAITIEAWVKTTFNNKGILYKGGDYENGDYGLSISSTGKARGILNDVGFVIGTKSIDDGNWYHIGATYDKDAGGIDEVKIYIDAVLDGTDDYSTVIQTSVDTLKIGYYHFSPYYFNGTIDNVIVSSTARSAAQIAADCYEVVCS